MKLFDNDIYNLILLLFTSSVLAIQVAEDSTLALRIKQFLYLNQPYNKKLYLLSKFKFWWRLLGRFYLLLPFYIFPILISCHHFLYEILDCKYCTSVWIFAILLTIYFNIYFIILSPLAILGIYIIERIRR